MDPKTYCDTAATRLTSRSAGLATVERTQVQILLAHFSRRPPDEEAFARELASLARSAERDGRRTLARAARQILADWEAVRAEQGAPETDTRP